MGVRENFVLGHTDLKILREMCQSNNIVKKLFQNIRGKLTSFSVSPVNYAKKDEKTVYFEEISFFFLIFVSFTIALIVQHHS